MLNVLYIHKYVGRLRKKVKTKNDKNNWGRSSRGEVFNNEKKMRKRIKRKQEERKTSFS